MRDIKALLFDVDGTLLDTHEFIYQAFETGISLHGHEIKTRQYNPDFVVDDIAEILKIFGLYNY